MQINLNSRSKKKTFISCRQLGNVVRTNYLLKYLIQNRVNNLQNKIFRLLEEISRPFYAMTLYLSVPFLRLHANNNKRTRIL